MPCYTFAVAGSARPSEHEATQVSATLQVCRVLKCWYELGFLGGIWGYMGHVAHAGERRDSYGVSVGKKKPNGNKLLGRPWRRWKDNIKMDVKQGGWEEIEWMNVVQGRDNWQAALNTVMNHKMRGIS